ncbi:MAG TPA: hypothetical protein VMS12_02695 [Thermoanaerobaculia bacterium]|nr:hypothetical protein [Thermoanaerobaculia bacterium]
MTGKPLLLAMLMVAGCASSTVDRDEPRRLLGRESDVRVDAQMFGNRINPGTIVTINYEIQNFRSEPIAFAEGPATADLDTSSRTITVRIGAEVPGIPPLPRLQVIGPGEKKSFTTGARMNFLIPDRGEQLSNYPQSLRIRVNILRSVEPFSMLVGPQEGPQDPNLAEEIFPAWVENIASVTTNSIPINWGRPIQTTTPPRRGRN